MSERERERERTRLQKDTYFIFFSIQKNNSFEKKKSRPLLDPIFFPTRRFSDFETKIETELKMLPKQFFFHSNFLAVEKCCRVFNCFANCLAFFTCAYPHQHSKVSYHVVASFYKLGACPIKLWLGRSIFAKFCSVIFKVFVTSNNLIEFFYVKLAHRADTGKAN